jgi:hypothetical protein
LQIKFYFPYLIWSWSWVYLNMGDISKWQVWWDAWWLNAIFPTPKRHPTQRFINTHVNPTSHCFPGRSAGFFGGFCRQTRRPCEWNLAALVFFKLLPLLGNMF